MMMITRSIWIIALLLLTACTNVPLKRDDPLIGKIYAAASKQQIEVEDLYRPMEKSQVIYLGETHDNPRHHELQLNILNTLIKKGHRPALGFEFFSVEQTAYLLNYTQSKPGKTGRPSTANALARLRRQLGWGSRDEAWGFYSPLLKLAKKYQLHVFGTDLAAGLSLRLSRVGLSGLSSLERRLLFPSGFVNADYRQLMYKSFTAAHCGWSQPQLLQRLYETWVARNDAMAMSISNVLNEHSGEPVVMILGSGHVANNMAVYERVSKLVPGVRQLNLGFVPVARKAQTAEAYMRPVMINKTRFAPQHQYLWFTQRVSYIDPCERFSAQLKKHSG